MARINDTTTFPITEPGFGDFVIGTDVSNTTNSAGGESVSFSIGAISWIEGSAVDANTGTTVDFSSLPSGIREIQIILHSVSLDDNDDLLVQLGTGGSPTTSGYDSKTNGTTSTIGFNFKNSSGGALNNGILGFVNFSDNVWIYTGNGSTGNTDVNCGGAVTLSGELDILRLTNTNAAFTDFSGSGQARIRYR